MDKARWQELPEEFPHPSTCWRRLRDWKERGVRLNIWRTFLSELNERQQLEWSESFLDGSFAPAKKGAAESEKPTELIYTSAKEQKLDPALPWHHSYFGLAAGSLMSSL